MRTNSDADAEEQKRELQVTIHLAEYKSLRSEMLLHINIQFQLPIWSLGSASIAIPLLLTQVSAISPLGVAGILLAITMVFSGIVMVYAASAFTVFRISSYISNYLEPQLNTMTNATAGKDVLYWESFVKTGRRGPLSLVLDSIGPMGIVLILLAPGVASLTAAYYVVSTGTLSISSLTWLNILAIVAVASFVIAMVALFLVTLYGATHGIKQSPRSNNGTLDSSVRKKRRQ